MPAGRNYLGGLGVCDTIIGLGYMLPLCQRPQFLAIQISLSGCLSVLIIWWLASPRADDLREIRVEATSVLWPSLRGHCPSFLQDATG